MPNRVLTARGIALWPGALVGLVLLAITARAQPPLQIDSEKSTLRVHVFKSGLFSGLGHEHEITAPIESGSISEDPPMVELKVDARRMKVADSDVSDKDRAEIQQTMLGPKVLDSERFPEIRFRSRRVSKLAESQWQAEGELSLHGQTLPVTVVVSRENGVYRGRTELKQKDFGISPVTAGGGAVKTRNEVRIEYEIYVKNRPQ